MAWDTCGLFDGFVVELAGSGRCHLSNWGEAREILFPLFLADEFNHVDKWLWGILGGCCGSVVCGAMGGTMSVVRGGADCGGSGP
mmetsp:Transcript_19798/g.42580  ORF Transcript_19798/g.42580 Transcript_19798/m.42580 type:complete len:85 (-) Transcript_19798:61-315(-)